MRKITNFDGITKYYCKKHHCFHSKSRKQNGKTITCKPFKECKDYAFTLDAYEIFNFKFNKHWNYLKKHQPKEHQQPILYIN